MKKQLKILLLTVIFYFPYNNFALPSTLYKEYGIALLLPEEYVGEAQRLSDQISRKLPKENLPNHFHITLYQGNFSESGLREIFKKLSDQNFISPRISMDSKIKYEDKKYINWNVKENKELEELHSKILKIASPYHQGILKRMIDNYQKFDSETQKQIDKYGVNAVADNYKPHVTLFYLPSENPEVPDLIENIIPVENVEKAVADSLVIGEIGYDGNLINIIDKIHLK